jgi:hypothetical protein
VTVPKAPPGYTKNTVVELAAVLGMQLSDLKSRNCAGGQHKNCIGSSVLLRPSPISSAGYQPFPCLCGCHEKFTIDGTTNQ